MNEEVGCAFDDVAETCMNCGSRTSTRIGRRAPPVIYQLVDGSSSTVHAVSSA
jgi:hypothetical protein